MKTMAILAPDLIALGAQAADKFEAIRKAGDLLVRAGRVRPAYVDGMVAREQTMSTSLGNLVAIPHGIFEARDQILETGISVLQLQAPIPWDDEGEVQLVIGIAASKDEHVGILANLAEVVEDEAKLADLLTTRDPGAVLAYLDAARTEE
jgi:phosphocarrier protein FPr